MNMDDFQEEIGKFYSFGLSFIKQGDLEKYREIAIVDRDKQQYVEEHLIIRSDIPGFLPFEGYNHCYN